MDIAISGSVALPGDADIDRDVDITDFNSLISNFGPIGNNVLPWRLGNFDTDIDITDFNTLAINFSPNGYHAAEGFENPEPSSVCQIFLAIILLSTMDVRKS